MKIKDLNEHDKFELFKENILHYKTYKDWLEWMAAVNVLSVEHMKKLPKIKLISGLCEDFACYFCYKYDIDMYDISNQHCLLNWNGLYFDGYNNKGVPRLTDLMFVKSDPYWLCNPQLVSKVREYKYGLLKRENGEDYWSHLDVSPDDIVKYENIMSHKVTDKDLLPNLKIYYDWMSYKVYTNNLCIIDTDV